MEIYIVNKDVTTSDADMIMHQVNCQGVMGSGVAKAIRNKWPIVYDKYVVMCRDHDTLLGSVQYVFVNERQIIVNLFGQDNYGYNGKRYTSYDALDDCFRIISEYVKVNNIKKIAIPYNMSCDRGGASWNVVIALITEHFKELNIKIEVCKI